ncbi:hypothetical protein GW17_00013925, partial [Ensete ventricosum]
DGVAAVALGVVAVRHVLRPVVADERGGADGGVPLPGWQGAAATGEELSGPGGRRGHLLPGLRPDRGVTLHHRQRAAAGDTCQLRSRQRGGGLLS